MQQDIKNLNAPVTYAGEKLMLSLESFRNVVQLQNVVFRTLANFAWSIANENREVYESLTMSDILKKVTKEKLLRQANVGPKTVGMIEKIFESEGWTLKDK